MKNTVIAYYSWAGNTRKIAEIIASKTGGDLFEILPQNAYSANYNEVIAQAKKELKGSFHPVLRNGLENAESYDTVFIGSPNWWSSIAPPVSTFLNTYDLSGKAIVPFLSHGGGGAGHMERDIQILCPQSVLLDGISIYDNGGASVETDIAKWLKEIGIQV